jgi:hypothetical protein
VISVNIARLYDVLSQEEQEEVEHLVDAMPDHTGLSLEAVLESCGVVVAVKALRAVQGYDNAIRLFMCRCAKISLPLFEAGAKDEDYSDIYGDTRPGEAIAFGEQFARNMKVSQGDLNAAYYAALDSANNADWEVHESAAIAAAWCASAYPPLAAAEALRWASDAILCQYEDTPQDENYGYTMQKFKDEALSLFRLEGEYGGLEGEQETPDAHMAALQILRLCTTTGVIPDFPDILESSAESEEDEEEG